MRCSQRNLVSSCHFLTTSYISTEKRGNLHREPSISTMGARRKAQPTPKTSLCACDTRQRWKQTENYKVHRRIFRISECSHLSSPFRIRCLRAAFAFKSQVSWAETVCCYCLKLVGITCKGCGIQNKLCSLRMLCQQTPPLILTIAKCGTLS